MPVAARGLGEPMVRMNEPSPIIPTWLRHWAGGIGQPWANRMLYPLGSKRCGATFHRDRIPTTLVAMAADEAFGSVSIVERDMSTHPDIGPWLAAVYAMPALRRSSESGRWWEPWGMDTPHPAADAAPKPKSDPTIWEVDGALWAEPEPVLRVDKPRKQPGWPRRDDRAIFAGLMGLARTGSQWKERPRRLGPKSTVPARQRRRVGRAAGALGRAWAVLLRAYDGAVGLDGDWRAADGCIVRAPFGKEGGSGEAEATGRNPTDRGKPGTTRRLLTDRRRAARWRSS